MLSYNIRKGGLGREERIAAVIHGAGADVVLLQEATHTLSVAKIAALAKMPDHGARQGESLAFLSRVPIASHAWVKPRVSRHAFLELVLAGDVCRLFGVHLAAVHAAWTEARRVFELRALLASIRRHEHGLHLLTGDFNTLAPGERFDFGLLPPRLRALVWMSGGRVRWRTIRQLLESGYDDAFRMLSPEVPGFTFPTWNPHVRLDFAFVPKRFTRHVMACAVLDTPAAREASDHLPLATDLVVTAAEGQNSER